MKISRFKKSSKILNYYCNNFQYRAPFQILIDATFCAAALQNKVAIEEQLRKYLQQEIKLITTQCIILESESLGPRLTGATMIVKKFHVHKCGHEGNPVAGMSCILSMTKQSRYIVATQDRKLQNILRKRPGQPLIYLHKATPTLDPPSDATKAAINKRMHSVLNDDSMERISSLKKIEGIPQNKQIEKVKMKKKPKNPNPLSCKKKKKQDITKPNIDNNNKITKELKRKRKRIKIPSHVKEVLLNSNKNGHD